MASFRFSAALVLVSAFISTESLTAGQITIADFISPVVYTDTQFPQVSGRIATPITVAGNTYIAGPTDYLALQLPIDVEYDDSPFCADAIRINSCLYFEPTAVDIHPYVDIRLGTPSSRAGVGIGGATGGFAEFLDARGVVLGETDSTGYYFARAGFAAWESLNDPIADIRVVMDFMYGYPLTAFDIVTVDAAGYAGVSGVPEPATALPAALGLAMLAWTASRRRRL